MARPLNRKKEITKSLVLHSASKLFIERGYENTRIKDIAEVAGVSYNDVFRLFGDKDTILSELVGLVLECQFETSEKVLKDKVPNKLYTYAFETVLQLYIAESQEHIREMYMVSYSLPHSLQTVHKTITKKLEEVFKDLLTDFETKDFYELEIASAGIMRGYLSVPCDIYFTMDRKVKRFIESNFKIYDVDNETIRNILEFLREFNFEEIANDVLNSLFTYLEKRT
jgi:AcrR family transcriptional regulator